MRTCFKILTAIILLGLLLTATGCEKPLDLSMQRSRIFLLGRLLVGKTCDVRLIYRVGPDESTPAQVTAGLSAIGGNAEQELAPGDNGIWRWSGQVKPQVAGEQPVLITARNAVGIEYSRKKLFPVYDTDKAIAIAAGVCHSLAVKADGTVVAWGDEWDKGPCDVPATITNAVAVAGGVYHSIALNADGTVVAWGKYYKFVPDPFNYGSHLHIEMDMYVPDGLADVVAVTACGENNLALKADGRVVAWGGDNEHGECDVPADLTDVIAIAAGCVTNFAIKPDGSIVSWGVAVKIEAHNAVAVSTDSYSFLVLDEYGETHGGELGWSPFGNIPIRAGSGFKAVAGGAATGLGLRKNGTVVSWLNKWEYSYSDFYIYFVNEVPGNFLAIATNACAGAGLHMALTANSSLKAWFDDWYVDYQPIPDELQ